MTALTVCQPYADLIARGQKVIENRTWPAPRRLIGQRVAIHAGKSRSWLRPQDIADNPRMVFGAVVATARLAACTHWNELREPRRSDPHANGPWCWILEDVERLEVPVPATGRQGLWTWTPPATEPRS